MPDVLAPVRSASLAEVVWRDAAGQLHVRGVIPLVGEHGPVLAFSYADADLARSIGAASSVLLALTEPRSTGTAFAPLLLHATPSTDEDRTGGRFVAGLMEQELGKYPPSRTLADSVLLRREHWWWLPRVLVDLTVTSTAPVPARPTPEHHLLVVDEPSTAGPGTDAPTLAVARVDATRPEAPVVDVASGTPGPGAAVLFGQDASFPDMERWRQWSWRGQWDGAGYTATSFPERVGLPPALGIMARWRRQRDLERRCRRALGD